MTVSRTRERILDAVLVVVQRVGLGGLSMEEVATEAGVSRQTVYRHFDNRHLLVEQAILREERHFIAAMEAAAAEAPSLAAAVEVAVETALVMSRRHPVLTELLEREHERLVPYLLGGRGPVISAAEPAVEALLRQHRPALDSSRCRLIADLATRMLVSYVVSPAIDTTDRQLAQIMTEVVVGLVDG